jgi:sodium/bile acid cotransporter 7
MLRVLRRHWFLLGLVLVLAAGFLRPHELAQLGRVELQAWVVAAVLFLMALPLDATAMWRALSRPKAVLLAVGINFGLLPLTAWAVSFALRPDLALGLLIVASIPTTQASCAVWTRRAGGNDAVAVMVTVVTNVFCFVFTPFWLTTMTGATVDIQPVKMMLDLCLVVVLPMVVAQLVRLYRPLGSWATEHKTPLGVLAQTGLLAMVFIGAVQAGLKLASRAAPLAPADTATMLAAVCGVHLAMLYCGFSLGRLLGVPWEDRIAVAFSGSQKTLMIGLHLALSPAFNNGLAMLPMVAYHVCQLLLDALIAERLRARQASRDTNGRI